MLKIVNSLWVFPIILTIHNVEEVLTMPTWLANNPKIGNRIRKKQFYFAVIIITLIAYVISLLLSLHRNNSILNSLYYGFIGAMIVNAFVPHLLATIYYKCIIME